ncbi:unnamed protein product, partial [Iphiclides podalirius]
MFLLGGGLPSGAIFVIEEDILDEDPRSIVSELPQPCFEQEKEILSEGAKAEMKIAWRYEGLGLVESSFGRSSNFGHNFDLSKHIDKETIQQSDVTYVFIDDDLKKNSDQKGFQNSIYIKLLTKIKDVISKDEFKTSSKNKNILRLCIQSLGSPIWMAADCDDDPINSSYGQDLIKFLYSLRIILRDTLAVAFITIPSHIFNDDHLMARILYSVDNAVRIESFAGSSRETNPVYSDYHGLFHVTKLSAIYSLMPYVPPSLDLAFKLRRKKFVIEKLHLPPELQESSEREQDDITAVPKATGCGGFRKKDIDF